MAITYANLFLTVLPVFLLIGAGAGVRRLEWVTQEGEDTLFALVFRLFFPALILESVLTNAAVRSTGNLLAPPLAGYLITAGGMGVGYLAGRAFGLRTGTGLRTFALSVGMTNYGYLPLPLMESLFGADSRGVLLVHNLGVEAAAWTVGLLVVSGASLRAGWRKLLNPPLFTLVTAVVLNLAGLGAHVPDFVWKVIHPLAACAVPLGLLLTGVSIQPHLGDPGRLLAPRVGIAAVAIRLALLPVILARVYGGQPLMAVQIVLATTTLGVITIPFWLRWGLVFAVPGH